MAAIITRTAQKKEMTTISFLLLIVSIFSHPPVFIYGRKKSIHGFLLSGKRKVSFSLSSQVNVICREKPVSGFSLHGKRKASFPLPSRIDDPRFMSSLRVPTLGHDSNMQVVDLGALNGRVYNFLRSHHSSSYLLSFTALSSSSLYWVSSPSSSYWASSPSSSSSSSSSSSMESIRYATLVL